MKRLFVLCGALLSICLGYAQKKEIVMPKAPEHKKYVEYSLMDKGYWWSVDLGIAPSLKYRESSMWSSTISFVNGYRFNDYLRLGIGIGANCYFANNDVVRRKSLKWTMPLFVNARGNFMSQDVREVVPFWSIDVGGALGDGFLFTPSVGCRIGESRSALIASLGYSYRGLKAKEELGNGRNFVVLKLGYEF